MSAKLALVSGGAEAAMPPISGAGADARAALPARMFIAGRIARLLPGFLLRGSRSVKECLHHECRLQWKLWEGIIFFALRSQKPWEVQEMDAAEALKELAGRKAGEPVKEAIERAAKAVPLSYWRAFDIWYRKNRSLDASEVSKIEDALERKRELDARNELSELRLRLERLDSLLRQKDAGFYRPSIDLAGAPAR